MCYIYLVHIHSITFVPKLLCDAQHQFLLKFTLNIMQILGIIVRSLTTKVQLADTSTGHNNGRRSIYSSWVLVELLVWNRLAINIIGLPMYRAFFNVPVDRFHCTWYMHYPLFVLWYGKISPAYSLQAE